MRRTPSLSKRGLISHRDEKGVAFAESRESLRLAPKGDKRAGGSLRTGGVSFCRTTGGLRRLQPQAGCRVWWSQPPFNHSKLMTIDGMWSLIGSANWAVRSLRLNSELSVELYDKDLSTDLARIIDAKCAQPLTVEDVDKRPFGVRLRDAAAQLSMPYI
jgi:PLD-like domain